MPLTLLSSIGNLPIDDSFTEGIRRGRLHPLEEGGLMADRGAQRREAKVAAIVESAWQLAREYGIAGVSLHALAREVGMRQPSLYAYFDSKSALYDAMFADGNRRLLQRLELVKLPREPRAALKKFLAEFVAFALEDPARYELLFERHIPGFTPSPTSYVLAEEV